MLSAAALQLGSHKLDLGECSFDSLPPEVSAWPRTALQQLRLTNNRLTDLPAVRRARPPVPRSARPAILTIVATPSKTRCSPLAPLPLVDPSWTPQDLTQLSALASLVLDHNKLTHLPAAALQLPRLEVLMVGLGACADVVAPAEWLPPILPPGPQCCQA